MKRTFTYETKRGKQPVRILYHYDRYRTTPIKINSIHEGTISASGRHWFDVTPKSRLNEYATWAMQARYENLVENARNALGNEAGLEALHRTSQTTRWPPPIPESALPIQKRRTKPPKV